MGLFDGFDADDISAETIGTATVETQSIEFTTASGTEKERTPLCPDCGEEIHIDTDSPDAWALTCDCDETPNFKITPEEE